jgi:hypothetical protein
MKSSRTTRQVLRLFVLVAVLCAFAAAPLLSSARVRSASINVVNNSGREIRHVYLSSPTEDNWGADQLSDSSILPGHSFAITNVSCDQPQIKVIGEDQDGCFVSAVINCGGDATWTITNETAADCGL